MRKLGNLALMAAAASSRFCAQTATDTLVGDIAKTESSSDLAGRIQNTVGDLSSLPLKNNVNFAYGPRGGTQYAPSYWQLSTQLKFFF